MLLPLQLNDLVPPPEGGRPRAMTLHPTSSKGLASQDAVFVPRRRNNSPTLVSRPHSLICRTGEEAPAAATR